MNALNYIFLVGDLGDPHDALGARQENRTAPSHHRRCVDPDLAWLPGRNDIPLYLYISCNICRAVDP